MFLHIFGWTFGSFLHIFGWTFGSFLHIFGWTFEKRGEREQGEAPPKKSPPLALSMRGAWEMEKVKVYMFMASGLSNSPDFSK